MSINIKISYEKNTKIWQHTKILKEYWEICNAELNWMDMGKRQNFVEILSPLEMKLRDGNNKSNKLVKNFVIPEIKCIRKLHIQVEWNSWKDELTIIQTTVNVQMSDWIGPQMAKIPLVTFAIKISISFNSCESFWNLQKQVRRQL